MSSALGLRAGLQARVLLGLLAASACQPAPLLDAPRPVLTGESAATSAPALTPAPPAVGMDLKGVGIEVWHPWYGPEAGLIDSQAAEFNTSNAWGLTVRTRGHTGYTELFTAVTDALGGGEAPQVVIALPEHALAWDADGFVVDVAAYVANPNYGLGHDIVDDFAPVFWNQDIVAGRQLGLPAQRTATVLTYNQTWALELGFQRPPATPEEFREQACDAHAELLRDDDARNDARGGWQFRADAVTLLSWLTAFGGAIQDGEGYRFLSPRNLEATVFLKELFDAGCAWVGTANEDPGLGLAERQALFGTAPLEELPELSRAMAAAENTDDWTVISFPGEGRSDIVVHGSSLVMLKSTPEQQLASWLFMSWMLEPDQQKEWVEVTGLFPLRTSLQGSLQDYGRSHPQWTTALGLLPDGTPEPQLASWRQVRIMMGDGFDAMFRSDTPAGRVAEILAIMDRTARDLAP